MRDTGVGVCVSSERRSPRGSVGVDEGVTGKERSNANDAFNSKISVSQFVTMSWSLYLTKSAFNLSNERIFCISSVAALASRTSCFFSNSNTCNLCISRCMLMDSDLSDSNLAFFSSFTTLDDWPDSGPKTGPPIPPGMFLTSICFKVTSCSDMM